MRIIVNIICTIAMALALLGECGSDTPTPSPDMHDYCDGSLFEPLSCDAK